jgi:hypothetical protein
MCQQDGQFRLWSASTCGTKGPMLFKGTNGAISTPEAELCPGGLKPASG